MLIGSEGVLGVITEAWVRVRPRPRFRASAGVLFPTFEAGAQAVRALAQSGLYPSNCRLLDPGEAALTGAAPDGRALLVLGFESADHPLDAWLERGLELCADHGGEVRGEPSTGERGESEGAWRDAFLQAPYLRDTLVAAGILAETFETAITWDRFESFVAEVRERAAAALGSGHRHLPAHARLPRRRRALLHGARPGAPGLRARAVGGAQVSRLGGDHRRRRHDHPPPRRRARPPPLVRPSAPGAVRRRRCAPPRPRSTRRGSSIPACSWIRCVRHEHGLGHELRAHPVAPLRDRPPELAQPARRRRRAGAGALVQVRRAELRRGGHGSLR